MKVGVVGSGQVAQHIVASAKESGIDVVLIGRVDGPTVSNRAFNPNRTWEDEGDLVLAVSDCDVVINTAAFRDLNACEKDPELARKVNIDLPRLLAQRGPRQVFLSTDYVFRGLHDSKRKEDDPTDALCVYGATKAAGEREVLALGGAVVRIASPWGIYPSPERAHFVDAIVPKGIASGKLDMPTDQYFSPTYLPALHTGRTSPRTSSRCFVPRSRFPDQSATTSCALSSEPLRTRSWQGRGIGPWRSRSI